MAVVLLLSSGLRAQPSQPSAHSPPSTEVLAATTDADNSAVGRAPEATDAATPVAVPAAAPVATAPVVNDANVESPPATPAEPAPTGLTAVPPPVTPGAIDTVLRDAANDLGVAIDRQTPTVVGRNLDYLQWESDLGLPVAGRVNMGAILELAPDTAAAVWSVRVTLALPDGTLHTARASLNAGDYELPTINALRMLTRKETASHTPPATALPLEPDTVAAYSDGRAVLAANGAVFGGYLGFALENAGGAAEARLVYPLVALGAGVGLAAALIIAEEWEVTRAEAWYAAAAGGWMTNGAILISSRMALTHGTDRYPYGLLGTAVGFGVTGFVTSQKEVSEAEALFAHSGGLLGTVVGGLVQQLAQPGSEELPYLGMGLGSSAGFLVAGLGGSALLPDLTSSRVLFADLGGFLGSLTGAAVASPALVGNDPPSTREQQIFVGSALGGLVLGSVVGYWFSEKKSSNGPPPALRVQLSAQQTPLVAPPEYSLRPTEPSSTTFGFRARW